MDLKRAENLISFLFWIIFFVVLIWKGSVLARGVFSGVGQLFSTMKGKNKERMEREEERKGRTKKDKGPFFRPRMWNNVSKYGKIRSL